MTVEHAPTTPVPGTRATVPSDRPPVTPVPGTRATVPSDRPPVTPAHGKHEVPRPEGRGAREAKPLKINDRRSS